MTFKEEFWKEWERLNPHFCAANDGFFKMFQHAARETWPAYFAPMHMLIWLVKAMFKKIF